jgi:hypothetical protein
VTEVLDLGAVFDRDTVKMPDGTTYELRNQQEFGVLEDHRLRTLLEQIESFDTSGTKSEEDAEKASKLLRDLATMLVVDLQTEIADWACVAIFRFWVDRAKGENPATPPQPAKKPAPQRTTGVSSRASKRSTAAKRKHGSTSRATR